MARRWTRRPEGSTWGDFGEDDQLGRLNLLTPAQVRLGALGIEGMAASCVQGRGVMIDLHREAGRHRFMLTAPPLRLPGATGSPSTPIATV